MEPTPPQASRLPGPRATVRPSSSFWPGPGSPAIPFVSVWGGARWVRPQAGGPSFWEAAGPRRAHLANTDCTAPRGSQMALPLRAVRPREGGFTSLGASDSSSVA